MFKNLSTTALGITGTQNEIIELALSYGFRGFDLDMVDFAAQVERRGLATSRRLIDSAKIKIGSFGLPVRLDAGDAKWTQELAGVGRLAEAATAIGCPRAVVMVRPGSEDEPYHQNFERHKRRLGELADKLAPHGVRLGVGFQGAAPLRRGANFEFIHDLDALQTLIKMVGQPNVGLALDVWEVYTSGGSVSAVGKLAADEIVTVALADAPADAAPDELAESARLLPMESGAIDSPAVVVALSEMGYQGPVTPVPSPTRFSRQGRDRIVRQAGDAIEAVWRAAGLSAPRLVTPVAR